MTDTISEIGQALDSMVRAINPEDVALERLLNRIAPVSINTKYVKAVVYGDLGVGKTVWACSSPNTLLVAIENGAKSLLNHPITQAIDVMEFVSVTQVEVLAQKIKEGKLSYSTYVLDSFSELQRVVLDNRLGETNFVPEGKDYQYNNEHMRRISSAFRDVPANVVFTSHEREPDDNYPMYRPDLAPKVTKTLGGYVDVMARLTSSIGADDEYTSTLRVRPTRKIMAKTRIRSLSTEMINSSFNDILIANNTQIVGVSDV